MLLFSLVRPLIMKNLCTKFWEGNPSATPSLSSHSLSFMVVNILLIPKVLIPRRLRGGEEEVIKFGYPKEILVIYCGASKSGAQGIRSFVDQLRYQLRLGATRISLQMSYWRGILCYKEITVYTRRRHCKCWMKLLLSPLHSHCLYQNSPFHSWVQLRLDRRLERFAVESRVHSLWMD